MGLFLVCRGRIRAERTASSDSAAWSTPPLGVATSQVGALAELLCVRRHRHIGMQAGRLDGTLKRAARQWAFASLTRSPGCRGALYNARRERGDGYAAALRHVSNRLLSSLHHCLRTGSPRSTRRHDAHNRLSSTGPAQATRPDADSASGRHSTGTVNIAAAGTWTPSTATYSSIRPAALTTARSP